jgi:hypothetical protein
MAAILSSLYAPVSLAPTTNGSVYYTAYVKYEDSHNIAKYEECRIMGCGAMKIMREQTFRENASL